MNRPQVKRIVLYWLPAVAWMGLIFVLSSSLLVGTVAAVEGRPSASLSDVVIATVTYGPLVHLVEYAVLAILIYRLLASYPALARGYVLGGTFVLASGYGLVDEFHQFFVYGRDSSLSDAGMDALGALAGLALATQWGNLQARLRRKSNMESRP